MDRRRFIATFGTGAVAAFLGLNSRPLWAQTTGHELPVDCSPPPPPGAAKHITFDTSINVAPRKSIWDLDATEVTRLQNAYQALRNLQTTNPSDPRGWMQQANVHCYNCSGGYDPSSYEIHGGWWFMPWHRCYLYVHERILANLIGDPSFRLAYWDWDTYPTHATFPPTFTQGSLYDQYRGTQPGDIIPPGVSGPANMSIVMGTQGTAAYMGGVSDPPHGVFPAGAMESNPHGPVHIWTGDSGTGALQAGCFYPYPNQTDPVKDHSQDVGCLDMGVLATAAQDPVFFAHHSNIDRLWDVWVNTPGSQGNYTDSSWLTQQFNFYDENGDWVYLTVADVLAANEQDNLRYAYQPPQTVTPPKMAALPPVPKGVKLKPAKPLTVAAQAATKVGTKPKAVSVALPAVHRSNLKMLAAGAPRLLELHIDGLKLPPNESAILKVYVGNPKANRASAIDASFVGTFSVVASGSPHRHAVVRNAVFELRPETAALLAKQTKLTVTLVPTRINGSEPKVSNLTYDRIYLSQRQ
ncbi:MAG TPA: tyrosinase family protein [Pyrinomonadaceae bacterium]|jgi:polyphenol oxidase|nr:tyrosinase family protein [Pyrinomonadaceae bacterium]